jgi:hypothetical protein
MLFLPKNLATLAEIAAKDTGRLSMTGIRVLEYADSYRVEATDGRRLLVIRGPNGMNPGYQNIGRLAEGLEDAPNGTFDAVVPGKEWTEAFKGAKKGESVGLVMGDGNATFAFGKQLLRSDLVEGKFRPIDAVIPLQAPRFTITVNPNYLADLLLTMAQLTPDNPSVMLHFYRTETPMGLTCMNEQGQFADAIVMPLIDQKRAMDSRPRGRKPRRACDVTTTTARRQEPRAANPYMMEVRHP